MQIKQLKTISRCIFNLVYLINDYSNIIYLCEVIFVCICEMVNKLQEGDESSEPSAV